MNKVYVVFKAYWMYQAEIYRVFSKPEDAEKCCNKLSCLDNVHSYISVQEVFDEYEKD